MLLPRLAIAILLPLACAPSQGVPAGTMNPVRWQLPKGLPLTVVPGVPFRVEVTAVIAPGWHLYTTDEPDDGPISTQFLLAEGGEATLLTVSGDKPLRSPAGDANQPEFYAGKASFGLRLRLEQQTKSVGPKVLHLTVRYQACNERLCLPPRSASLALPLMVSKSKEP